MGLIKKDKNSDKWDQARNQFMQSRIVELPVSSFKMAQNHPVFETSEKTQGRVALMVDEQLRTIYHSVWTILERMAWVEKVQGISPKAMTEEQCLNEILPIVRSGPAFREGFQLYDSGNYCSSYTGGCEAGSDGKDDGFYEFGRIVDFIKDIEGIENPILDRSRVWHSIRCLWQRNLALVKFRIDKHIIIKERTYMTNRTYEKEYIKSAKSILL